MTPTEALHTYFGLKAFRPLQQEIIQSVLDGRDTLALLPTGGGKSLCFQIPVLVQEGLCLVITPLVALMKDQVANLHRRGIHAAAIYSGMSYDQQQTALDNCQYGPYRCLYISPERLESNNFRLRLRRLPVTLIAVDEAHCISQWGYDFRPSYLKIGELLQTFAGENTPRQVPVLALTATATPEVVEDIQDKLCFRNRNVLRTSFARANLHYVVRRCAEDRPNAADTGTLRTKTEEIQHILSRVRGSAIVYVRNRKRAEELAKVLHSSFYHAGLTTQERTRRQEAWTHDTGVIVCTNAFGMGIDKPDVRVVIHYDLPDSPEAYFQEAGRAGRDGQPAFAVLLYSSSDRTKARKRVRDNYPTRAFINEVYHKTSDFLTVGAESGAGHSFVLHTDELCRVMHLPVLPTYSALHILSAAGYINFQEQQETQTRVLIHISRNEMAGYALSPQQHELLLSLMRQYPGIFTDLQYIHEEITDDIHRLLVSLASRHIVTYLPASCEDRITYLLDRQRDITLSSHVLEEREAIYVKRLKAMVEYAEQTVACRQQFLLHYFGESDAPACGRCDVCRSVGKTDNTVSSVN